MNDQKILVVDDEASIRDILETAFSSAGYIVRSVASGEEAMEILAHESYPVMFIDLGLDTMSGFDLCERIRKQGLQAVIYAITGYAKLLGPDEILEAGFDDYFEKPFRVEMIFQAVKKAFKKIAQMADSQKPVIKPIKRILIIDDDDRLRGMLKEMLESEGFEVSAAVNGYEGLCRLAEAPVDLVITDIIMPVKDGTETLTEIIAAYPATRIIAMSGGGGHF